MLQRFLTPTEFPSSLACNCHVLVVTPGFPASEDDSLCIPPVQVLLKRIANAEPGPRVSVISLHYPSPSRTYEWSGLQVIALGARGRRWPLRLVDLGRGVAAARRLHSSRPIDVVQALWLTDAALLAGLIARHLDLPLAATIMGQDALPSNSYLRLLPLSRMRLAAVSERAATVFRDATRRQVDAVIPWGLDARRDRPSAAWAERPIHVLGVGSLTRNKEFTLLLRLCHRLLAAGRPCRAVLIGDGPQRNELQREADRLGLGPHLDFEGHRQRTEVLERMADARILVHPARYEGFGFVFSEALASGMSVISRPVGAASPGPRWRLAVSEDEFFKACISLLDDPPSTEPAELSTVDGAVQGYADLLGLGAEREA